MRDIPAVQSIADFEALVAQAIDQKQ